MYLVKNVILFVQDFVNIQAHVKGGNMKKDLKGKLREKETK